MSTMIIKSIPDKVHAVLRARAKRHNRSLDAEVRAILEEATRPEARLKMGDALAAMSRGIGLNNEDFALFARTRGQTPAEPVRFE